MTSAPPPSAGPHYSCVTDPEFATIFAFCERFGDSCCGITVPTFQELQDMLEKTDEVPGTLVDLHVKLLRRVRKGVHIDRWEKAILKFCQTYSIPDFWELEQYGYKGISIKLKLRILKTLLEAQFDSNVKFKAEINKIESSILRSQPLGWDKSGTAYWVQFDRACNLRVYKEDSDEHTWEIVAKDRSTLVNLINELSGTKDDSLDDIEDSNSIETGSEEEAEMTAIFDQEKLSVASSNSTLNIKDDKEENNIKSFKNPNNTKKEVSETDFPIVGETIEEAVMVVKGEGSGQECDTGNPDEPNDQDETSKNEDIKKPKLWSIDTICSSSKDVKEEIIPVPKTGFFFGDDSVSCFSNVSNGESSHPDKDKLNVDPPKEDEVVKTTEKLNAESSTIKKSDSEFRTTEKSDTEFRTNEQLDAKLRTTDKSGEVLSTSETSGDVLKISEKSNEEVLNVTEKSHEVLKTTEKSDEVDCNAALPTTKLLNEECTTKNEEQLDCEKNSNQSVFNIKVHEEEVQITERKANEVFTKSESNLKNEMSVNESVLVDTHSKLQVSQLISSPQVVETEKDSHLIDDSDKRIAHETNIQEPLQVPQSISSSHILETKEESHTIGDDDKYDTDQNVIKSNITDQCDIKSIKKEVEFKKIKENCSFDLKLINNTKPDIDKLTVSLDTSSVKSKKSMKTESDQLFTTSIDDQTIKNSKLNNESSLELNKPLANEPNPYDKIENTESHTKKETVDINEQQNVDIKVQNLSKLDKKTSNETNPPDQILTKINHDIVSKEVTTNLLVKDNKIDKKSSEEIKVHPSNNLKTISTYSNDDINQNTENESSSMYTINSSSCSKVHDQIIMKADNQCLDTFKQINDDQNNVTHKNTLHNIRNIINTDAVVCDSNKANKESTNMICDKSKELENFPSKNEVIFVGKVGEKETKSVVDSQIVSSNKHSSDKVIDNTNKIPACLEDHKLLNEQKSSSIEDNKVSSKKSKINITKLETKTMDCSTDLNEVKDNELPGNKSNTELIIPSGSSQKISVNDQIPKCQTHEKTVELIEMKKDNLKMSSIKIPCIKDSLNECKKDKHKLIKIENKVDDGLKNELKNTVCDIIKVGQDICKKTPTIKTDEKNVDDVLLDDENLNKKLPVDNETENLKEKLPKENAITDHEENINLGTTNQKLKSKTKTNTENIKEEDVLKTSNKQTTLLTHEKTENVLNIISKEECEDSEIIDQNDEINEEIEKTPKKKGRPGRKKGKGKAKNFNFPKVKEQNKDVTEVRVKRQYKPRQKKVVSIAEEVTVFPELPTDDNKRRSRRIAEIKIKEQVVPNTQYDDIDIPLKVSKKKEKIGKKVSTPTKKITITDESDDEDENEGNLMSKKFKKRKKKGKPGSLKKSSTVNPWNLDSGSSSSENHVELFEDYDHEEEDETPRPGIEPNVSDHEFSPESDIEDEEEYMPEKRARTARKKDQDEEMDDDMACRKCNKSDQPEWILLCDTCNQGWHASCLRPPLMVIPDGDWYCPSCRHKSLLNALKDVLKKYDGESKKRENEELRRKRLAYVGISLQNVIPSKKENVNTEKQAAVLESSEEEDEESESESESYDSEPLYQLRARRQTNVSYRFNEYDNMIDEAIFEETGIDESASRKLTEVKIDKNDNDENSETDNEEKKNREDSPIAPALLHLRGRKKSKKLTNLDISSDDGSDEDFKGPSEEDDDFDEELSGYSDDSVKRRPQPTRRSVRNRKNVVDPDFINDDSSDENAKRRSKKKRSRPWSSDSSNSEGEDSTWGKKKKKRTNALSSSFKQSKGLKRKHNSNRKSKIKYGMDSDSDGQPQRRTRGRQITYAESDDSEVEVQPKKRKKGSDEEDEYVLNDEELEVENDDHNLETDDEDAIVSNEEKNEEETDEEEEEEEEEKTVVKEETDSEEKKDEKKKDNSKPKMTTIPLQTPKKSQSTTTEVVKPVIREPTVISSPVTSGESRPNVIHHRLSPEVTDNQAMPQLSIHSSKIAETSDKRKKQAKKCPSPNPPSINYSTGAGTGSGCYPCPPDATKVVLAAPESAIPVVSVLYNKPHVTVSTSIGGFKPMGNTAPPPTGFLAAPYRTTNKIATEGVTAAVPSSPTYHPPQAYQASLPTNYSSYPVNYTTSGTSVPPPPPTIPFRNVAVASSQVHETHPPLPTTVITEQSTVTSVGSDSEFGGLVSYFSSQQEDDFDA